MKFVGSIDQGTTSTRFILFDEACQIVASHQMEHKQIMVKEGWCEHDPMEIWENTKACIQTTMEKANLMAEDLSAVGITNQRETTVAWDKTTGKPLCNAIVWMDMRSHTVCEAVIAKVGGKEKLQEHTGLPIVPYFAGTKMKWLLDNNAAVKECAEKGNLVFGTIDSWLLFNLSGKQEHITDVTNASRTLLMDIKSLEWSDYLCETIGVSKSTLPKIVPSSGEMFKIVDPPCLQNVSLSGVLGDQQSALFGQCCFEPGEAKNTYGTGCFLLMNTGNKAIQSTHGLLTTVAYQIAGQEPVYALEGSVAIGGALVQWLRDNLCIIESAPEVEPLANSVPDNGGVYFVPAFSGLYAPYWKDDARGVIVGMTRFCNKGHIARATLEAVAYQSADVFQAMEKDSKVHLKALKVDGGMVVNETLMQFQSDVLSLPVVRPKVAETTALGAAMIAGIGCVWKDLDDMKSKWAVDKTWSPEMPEERKKELFHGWNKAIKRTYGWVDESS
uniref:glycerol kinase n=1 Tax=Mucochytrium quahogii TaxID=96639 RepID=A0A7S2SJ45_9STRA|mmetsp:Transcript_1015/g.1638  ORF Transcript_1015/g.1638 Transcript_1015/m.1638 type:complete len:500 (+) Transcript_1015:65-1564(+)|eukprot:CAMPEP_0203758198 /NCGR_PEP_ID=MMETSP0098-20131031/10958_1 /ASSEMBLY_ACC=CAM_ASM_000208 /TAXON_ID=96639 /ORGANISM=" , Strain NY0313808BC1" /LENGTH=499 /DNA_ID=CAMNT_0050650493 /DNA_START=103 /DNA_END=1602 /DNA_ORIENTATION=-